MAELIITALVLLAILTYLSISIAFRIAKALDEPYLIDQEVGGNMSTKVILEESIRKIEREIEADEAWIEFVDNKVQDTSEEVLSLSARFDEMEAKIDDITRIVENLGKTLDAIRTESLHTS